MKKVTVMGWENGVAGGLAGKQAECRSLAKIAQMLFRVSPERRSAAKPGDRVQCYAMSGVPGSGRTKLAIVGRSVQPCLA